MANDKIVNVFMPSAEVQHIIPQIQQHMMMIQLGKRINRRVDMVEDTCIKPFTRESVNRDKIMIYERAH